MPMHTFTRIVPAALLLIAGAAAANNIHDATGVKAPDGMRVLGSAQPVTLSAVQRASIAGTYAWLGRDAAVMQGPIEPRVVFAEVIGLHERTDRLNVKVKSLDDMTQSVLEAMPVQIRGAQGAPAPDVAADARRIASQRMAQARERLAPARIDSMDDIDLHTVRAPEGVSAEVAAEVLMRTGDYEFVSIDWLCYPTDTSPNDPLLTNQWYHQSNRMDSVGAWDYTQGSGEVLAVCDSGIDLDHPDLAGALVPGFNSATNTAEVDGGAVNDINGHGTLVAGCSVAIGNNGTGISGVGWDFGLMPVRVTNNPNGTAFLSDILQGAKWGSSNGAYVSNCSFGGSQDPSTNVAGLSIRSQGNHLVFSAGNFGLSDQVNDYESVVIVGASNQGDNFANFSHTGPGIDCIAPGSSVYTADRFGGYGYTQGTSFSAPLVAASLMLTYSANPDLSAEEVEFILLNACDDKEAIGEDDLTGHGRVNVGRAVRDAIFGPELLPIPFTDGFADADLRQWRDATGDAATSDAATNEPSGDDALRLAADASIRTVSMRASNFFEETGQFKFSTQHKGTEAGEGLLVEYFSLLATWDELVIIPSDGDDQEYFRNHRFEVPFFAAHDDLQLRFTALGDAADDAWFVDDVEVSVFDGNTIPWNDDFEDGLSSVFDWDAADAVASTEADGEPDGTMSAKLAGPGVMETKVIDITLDDFVPTYVRLYTQHKGTEAGDDLVVEVLDLIGTWTTIATIEGSGADQTAFDLHQIQLTGLAIHPGFKLRITSIADSADDEWFIDGAAVTTVFIDESDPCPADYNGDGVVSFPDVGLFLSAFSSGDPAADFNGDGVVSFPDVGLFLAAFSAGCP